MNGQNKKSVLYRKTFSCKKNLVYRKRAKIKMLNRYVGYIKIQISDKNIKDNKK